ncbi:hypothetical protein C3K47_03370 [Solitalea longa]|uniref:T9SS C-terminal target domain-containing protein n=1 Tax=Solitalea longa TaxID=2079460 RepID=A0A2S5A867_9SPHI|nr:hypothetical protein [Solitalea longa]POY38447.1 hypothetical protein C3K47_03370 [Solitalea longa]
MKKKHLLAILTLGFGALAFASCSSSNDDPTPDPPIVNKEITGEITQSVTYKRGSYVLKGFVYIKNGATVTFEAGSVIKGDKDSKATIIVTRGGKLVANGTEADPVVFTSGQPAGQRAPGDWGGIILLGKAPINVTGGESVIEGGVDNTAGDGKYGGNDPADNSGSLKYVRIEYPGIAFQPNNEINGLTCGGVGSGTTLDHIQVSFSGDDSFEFFGGTVNAKYLVSVHATDDNFDFDNGFSGKLQFIIAQQDPAFADNAGTGASNGIESDNDANGTTNTPITRPVISNMTLIGVNSTANTHHAAGNHWRRSSKLVVRNSIITGFATAGVLIESDNTAASLKDGSSEFKDNLVYGIAKPFGVKGTTAATYVDDAALNAAFTLLGNSALNTAADAGIEDAFNQTAPNFLLKSASVAKTGASFTGLDSYFTQVTYKGAFDTTNWTSGWGNFNPQATTY